MTPSTINEAYTHWLGISAGDAPPNHYQLLAIAPQEANPQAILSAYAQRSSMVTEHLSGSHADLAGQVLTQLAAAQSCLLNPQAKAEYDHSLRQRQAEPMKGQSSTLDASSRHPIQRPAPRRNTHESTAVAASVATAAATASAVSSASSSAASEAQPGEASSDDNYVPQKGAGEPTTVLPWLIGGVCAGLLGVAVLAMVLFGARDRQTARDVDDDNQLQNSAIADASARAAELERRQGDRTSPPPRSQDNTSDNRIAPVVGTPDALHWDRDPDIVKGGDLLKVDDLDKPTVDSHGTIDGEPGATTIDAADASGSSAEPSTTPLAMLPKAIALPRRASASDSSLEDRSTVLARIDIEDPREVTLQFASDHLAGGSGRFALAPREALDEPETGKKVWDVQHVADEAGPHTIGQYTLADGELSFQWEPDAQDESTSQLQNQPLTIAAGEETATIAQRTATAQPPIVVRVDAGAVSTAVPIEDPPEQSEVMVAFEQLGDAFGDYAWDPQGEMEVGESAMLRFGAETDAFQFALQVSAEQSGPDQVRIEARPMFRQGNRQKWDYFRPKQAAQLLGALKQQQVVMDAQLQQIQKRYRKDQVTLDQATAIHNRQSALLLENIANLERINNRCQDLQNKGELHFRVYAQSGEQQIDLVRTQSEAADQTSAESPDEESVGPPADPNVGPPPDDEAPIDDPAGEAELP